MRSEPVLELRDLSVRFRGMGTDLIDGVSLSIQPGKTLCLVGESGCGKSVTSLAVMGLLPRGAARITHGQALYRGRDLGAMGRAELESLRGNRIAMIFQEPMTSLNPVFTIGDQVAESVRRHKGCSPAEARARALEMFRKVRIPAAEKRLDDYPHQLSGGMRQRVMIAMALSCDPQVLIADEPTTALDVTIQAQILDLMLELKEKTGTAIVLITHDLGVVAETTERVVVMYAGRKVEEGTVAEVYAQARHPYTQGLLRAAQWSRLPCGSFFEIPGTVPSLAALPPGCRFAPRCAQVQDACRAGAPQAVRLGERREVECLRVEGPA